MPFDPTRQVAMLNLSRLLRQHAPKKAMPKGAVAIADLAMHPRGWGACSAIRMPSGIEAAWDGTTVRSLPRNWRDLVEWTPVEE